MKSYAAVYSESGGLICYTDNPRIVREVARAMTSILPSTPANDPVAGITAARRAALETIASGGGDEK